MRPRITFRCFLALLPDKKWMRLTYEQRIEIIELTLVTERYSFELHSCWPSKTRRKVLKKIVDHNTSRLLLLLRSQFGLETPTRHIRYSLFTPSQIVNTRLEEYWTYIASKLALSAKNRQTDELLQSFGRLFISKSKCRASLSDMVDRACIPIETPDEHFTTVNQIAAALRILKQINGCSGVSCGVLPQAAASSKWSLNNEEITSVCYWTHGPFDLQDLLADLSDELAFTPVKCIEFSGQSNIRMEQIQRLITELFITRGFALVVDGGDVLAVSARTNYCCVLIVEPDTGEVSWYETNTPKCMKRVLMMLLRNSKGKAIVLDFVRDIKSTVPFVARNRYVSNHPVTMSVCVTALVTATLLL